MLPDEKAMCHRTGFAVACFELVTQRKCRRWEHLQGSHPQTGQPMDKWGCVDDLRLFLDLQAGQHLNALREEIGKLRGEVVQRAVSPPAWAVQQMVRESLDRAQQELQLEAQPMKMIQQTQ